MWKLANYLRNKDWEINISSHQILNKFDEITKFKLYGSTYMYTTIKWNTKQKQKSYLILILI